MGKWGSMVRGVWRVLRWALGAYVVLDLSAAILEQVVNGRLAPEALRARANHRRSGLTIDLTEVKAHHLDPSRW